MDFIYGAYAMHEQEKQDIINEIVTNLHNDNNNFSINLTDDFSEKEVEEIKQEVWARL